MKKINKRIAYKTIKKFEQMLNYCDDNNMSTEEVVKYFGKERARKWCGSWDGYPDIDMIQWWEKRYNSTYYFENRQEHLLWNRLDYARKHKE